MGNQDLALSLILQAQDQSSSVVKNLSSSLSSAQMAAAKADVAMKNLAVSQANAAVAIDKAVAASNNSALSYDQVALAAAKADAAVAQVGVADAAASAAAQKAAIAEDELATSLNNVAAKSAMTSEEMAAANVRNAESMTATSASAEEAGASIGGMGGIIGGLGPMIAMMAIPAVIGLGKSSIDAATKYQQGMNMVQALTGQTADQMKTIDVAIKQMASDTGVAASDLTGGLYNMLSAGYNTSDAMKMLKLTTEDAVIGMTDSTTTATALTKVMNGFGISVKYADQVNGEMMRTIKAGQMSVQDYSSAVSKSSSVAVQYHDTMENMNAVFATLTASGIKNATQASTDYNNLLKVLNGNTKSVAINAHALNSAFDENKFAAMDVADKVNYLNTMIVQHGHNITDVIGKQQNAAAAFTALSTHAGLYAKNLKDLNDQQANAVATQQQWQITQQGLQVSLDRMKSSLGNLMIDLGNAFLPIVTQVVNWVSNVVNNFVTWEEQTHFVQNALDALGKILTPLWQGIQQIGAALSNVWQAISPIFDNIAGQAQGWGQNLMGGFISGIESMLGVLTDILNSVATEISNFIGFASPSKKGPGRNLMKWGPAMVLSFAEGIKSSSPLVQDAISDLTQYFDQLNGNTSAGGSALAANAAQSFVSIGSALQTVTLGQPFGASGTAGGNSTTSAIGKNINALGTNTATIAASTAAKAKKQAQTAKQAAAQIKSQQAAQAATSRLDATLQKAISTSNTSDVQALVDKARAAQSSGNMAMAKFYASQAQQLADKDKAAADKAAKKGKTGKGGAGGGLGGLVPAVNENDILGQFQKKMDSLKPPTIKPKLELPDVGKGMSEAIQKGAGQVQNALKGIMGTSFGKSMKEAFDQAMPGFASLGQALQGLLPAIKQINDIAGSTLLRWIKDMTPAIQSALPVIMKLAGDISGGLAGAIKFYQPYIMEAIKAIGQFSSDIADRVGPIVKKWFDQTNQILDFFKKHWDTIWSVLGPELQGIWDVITGVIKTAWSIITGIFKVNLDLMSGNWGQAWKDIQDMTNGALDGLKSIVTGGISMIVGSFKPLFIVLSKIPGPVGDMAKGVLKSLDDLTAGTKEKTLDMSNKASANVIAMKLKVLQHTEDLHIQAANHFEQMRQELIKKAQATTDPVQKAALDMKIKTLAHLEDLQKQATIQADLMKKNFIAKTQDMSNETVGHSIIPDMVTNSITEFIRLSTDAEKWAIDMMNKFTKAITDRVAGIISAVKQVSSAIASYLHFSTPDVGPLKDSDDWMPHMMSQLASGMTSNLSSVQQAAQSVAQSIGYIHTAAGVALPDYNAGTGQTIADVQPVSASSGALAGRDVHIHVHLGDSDGDAKKHGKKVADEVKKQLAHKLRGQSIAPRYTSGGTR